MLYVKNICELLSEQQWQTKKQGEVYWQTFG